MGMRIAVMGSGGVGGFFGAKLAHGGANVTFVARGRHLAAMREHGLRVESATAPVHLPSVQATDDPATIGPVDLVMFTVKLWDTDAAIEQIRPLMRPETTVASFQNGVVAADALSAAFSPAQVLGGVSYVSAVIEAPGVIRHTGVHKRLSFGEFDGTVSRRVEAFRDACAAGGFDGQISPDMRREIWEKYVMLVGLSATTASMRSALGPIRENKQTRAFLLDIMREVVAVAQAKGIQFPDDYADKRMPGIDRLAPEMKASMAHDLERGNRLEVPWLSGGVAALGAECGVPVPLNRAVADILALYVNGATS